MPALDHIRTGSGPPLVLIHGVGSEWRAFEPVLERLARERDVIALDAPGFGGSAPLAAGIEPTIGALTDAISAFLREELGLERPHVAGNSMGGAIALELARRGEVASATGLSPAGFWTDAERRFCQRSLRNGAAAARALGPDRVRALTRSAAGRTLLVGQYVARPWRMTPEAAARITEAAVGATAFAQTVDAFDRYRFARGDELRPTPVTVAWGERDWLLLPREGRRVPRVVPHARLVWLPGCGHVPTHDDPDLVARVLLEASAGR